MEWWHAALLGLVEGITEYLPVSSTGPSDPGSSLLGLDRPEQRSRSRVEVGDPGGAILAVLDLPRRGADARGLSARSRACACSSRGARLRSRGVLAPAATDRAFLSALARLARVRGRARMIWLDRGARRRVRRARSRTRARSARDRLFQCAAMCGRRAVMATRSRAARPPRATRGVSFLSASRRWAACSTSSAELSRILADGRPPLRDARCRCTCDGSPAAILRHRGRWRSLLVATGLARFRWYRSRSACARRVLFTGGST